MTSSLDRLQDDGTSYELTVRLTIGRVIILATLSGANSHTPVLISYHLGDCLQALAAMQAAWNGLA